MCEPPCFILSTTRQESLCELKLAWKQCSNRLSRLELSLDAVREGNLKLQRCIQEMNRTAIDQPAPEVKASPNESVGASGGKREKALQEELAKLHREIKETQERVRRCGLRCCSSACPSSARRVFCLRKRKAPSHLTCRANRYGTTVHRVASWRQDAFVCCFHDNAKEMLPR